jgi:hypothetical protein
MPSQRSTFLDTQFSMGQPVKLPGHFLDPVTLRAIRFIASGHECRVRLSDGTPDEPTLSLVEEPRLRAKW